MACVPQQRDEGLYPEPDKSLLVSEFETKLWNGQWYITAGQNPLFDIFPCQVHFFTETSPGKFFGKLNLTNKLGFLDKAWSKTSKNKVSGRSELKFLRCSL